MSSGEVPLISRKPNPASEALEDKAGGRETGQALKANSMGPVSGHIQKAKTESGDCLVTAVCHQGRHGLAETDPAAPTRGHGVVGHGCVPQAPALSACHHVAAGLARLSWLGGR